MGVQERRARDRQDLRQDILDAARDLFVRDGYENVSMRKIAEKIDYSPTTIYLHFEDKADLFDCLCEETFARLERMLIALESATTDPLERLRSGLRAYIEFGLKHPNDYQVAFLMDVRAVADPGRLSRCRAMGEKTFNHLRKGVKHCIEAGIFRPVDTEATSQAIWAAIHGLPALLIVHPHYPWLHRNVLIDTLLDTVLRGLRA